MADAYAEAMEMARELRDLQFGTDAKVVAAFDQFGSSFRATMAERFGVDLSDATQRRAAFAGAWSIFEYLADLYCPAQIVAGVRTELAAYVQLDEMEAS